MERSHALIPDMEQQSPAVDFIENSLNNYHPAFSTPPSRYDPSSGGFVIVPSPADDGAAAYSLQRASSATSEICNPSQVVTSTISPRPSYQPLQALEFWDSLFSRAMTQLNQLYPQEPDHLLKSGQRIRDKTDWTQVFDQIETAKNEYSSVDNKFKAGFRKVHRKFGEHAAEPLNRITKLVPGGGDLGAVAVTPIIGCVQILLEAARSASNVRKTVSDAFDQVDKMFADIELFIQIYPEDKNIENASIDLLASTLFAAENVIGFFTKGTWKKFLTATTQREHYERGTIESLTDVKIKCLALLQEAEKSNMYQVYYGTKVNLRRSEAVLEALERVRREQIRPHELRNDMFELMKEFEKRWELQLQKEAYLRRKEHELFRVAFCIETARTLSQFASTPPHWPQTGSSTGFQRSITPEDLLEWIAVPDLLAKDLQKIADRRKVQVQEPEQARAEQLIRTGQVREWLVAPISTQLLVHGNYDRRAYISGLTIFCMSLTATLSERNSRFIPLTFFCGLHAEPMSGAHAGGRAIIQSFIGQLVQQFDFGGYTQMPALQMDENKIRTGDVDELCGLFEALVRALPKSVVLVCLIDGILYYEREDFKEDMAVVLSAILKLSADESVAVPLKVLITSPTKTTEVRLPFPAELILSMDALPPTDLIASSSRLSRELQESGLNQL